MPIEVELKAHLDDPRITQVRIEELTSISQASAIHRQDTYYRLGEQHVRLRQEEGNITVTTKVRRGSDGLEINDEAEFSVDGDQAHALDRFFRQLGYEIDCIKTKQGLSYFYRAEDGLKLVTIEVIDVPPLGWFIEIETLLENEAKIEEARAMLLGLLNLVGVDHSKIERRPYLAMLKEAGNAAHPQHRGSGQDSGQ